MWPLGSPQPGPGPCPGSVQRQGLEEEAASSSTHSCELGEVDLPSWGPVDEAGFSPRVTWQMFSVGVWSSRWRRGPSRKAVRRVFRGTRET